MEGDKGGLEDLASRFNLEKGLTSNLLKAEPTIQGNFISAVEHSGLNKGEKKIGNMLYSISTKLPVTLDQHRALLAKWVGNGEISNPNQLDFVIDYLKAHEGKGGADIEKLRKECGVGVVLTVEQIEAVVAKHIANADNTCKKFDFLQKAKLDIPYVEGKVLKEIFERMWKEKGLPDAPVKNKEEKKPKAEKQAKPKGEKAEAEEEVFHIKDISELIGREMRSQVNSKELIEERNKKFGDRILTRFPPEPNGYLHIGHCKAMRFNFMQAKLNNGGCYLRFDDTNPTKENKEFIDNIIENVHFMGYTPMKITHSSENFEQLHAFAVQLIKQGDAFVCAEPMEEMRRKRGEGIPSPYRDRSVQENLKLFEEMRLGLHQEGALSLRAKIDYKHPNTTLRDPVIYRIKFHPHPHVGDKWCIYPMYDYTHPICDSLEGISHSLCSLQFQIRRQLYYWTLEKLGIYRPSVWEYSRLNITYTVMSKRKIQQLVASKRVIGWDDPRLLTINGMRRRGYPPQAINAFCDAVGVTRRGNQNYISFGLLEHEVRKFLDLRAPRTMAVLEPVLMVIEGVQKDEEITIPLFPKDQAKGTRKITYSKRILVERSDIKLVDQKGFYGIAPNKVIGLKYASSFFIKEVVAENGIAVRVIAEADAQKRKPNSYLNWIAESDSVDCVARNYGVHFTYDKPGEKDNYLDYINPHSLEEYPRCKIHRELAASIKAGEHVQFERKGFYTLDKDSKEGALVWNQTVGLVDRIKK